MDTVSHYRQLIQRILLDYARIPYAYGRIQQQAVFDPAGDHYLLVNVGWDHEDRRVHGCLVHVDLIDGKFWVQRDGTESGIACDLEDAGVPREHIVLAFREPELRPHTGYAVA